jgi:hypothetical protein
MDGQTGIKPAQKEMLFIELLRKELLRVLLLFLLVSNVFLFLRIVLRVFGADPANAFAAFIFFVSSIILLPVFGIFPQVRDTIVGGHPSFDFSAFIALFCYNILTFLAMGIIQIGCSMIRTSKQANEASEKGKPIDTKIVDRSIGSRSV